MPNGKTLYDEGERKIMAMFLPVVTVSTWDYHVPVTLRRSDVVTNQVL